MNRSAIALGAFVSLVALAATPALAHTGIGPVSGLAAGFGHPMGGLDHVLAMIAVGILGVQQGGRAVWLVPATFVVMMIVGGVLGAAHLGIPFVEQGILGSVIILGLVIAAGGRLGLSLAMGLVGVFAVFHGHAHGSEMPVNASGLSYGLGFAAATALLHAAGIALAFGARKIGDTLAPIALRAGGGAIAAAGVVLAAA
jgi:urease accessory protein